MKYYKLEAFIFILIIVAGIYDFQLYLKISIQNTGYVKEASDLDIKIKQAEKRREFFEQKLTSFRQATADAKRDSVRNGIPVTPEAKELMAVIEKSHVETEIDAKYGQLLRKFALSAEKETELKDFLVKRSQVAKEMFEKLHDQGMDLDDAWQGGLADLIGAENAKIKQLIGVAGLEQLQSYEKTIGARNTIRSLDDLLWMTSIPLTLAQEDALVQLFTDHEALVQQENLAYVNIISSVNAPIPPHLIKASSSILSPLQVNSLERMREQTQRKQALSNLLRSSAPSD